MNLKRLKASACVIATGTLFGLSGMKVSASGLSNMLPSAGFSTAVEHKTTLKQVQAEVKEIVKADRKFTSQASTDGIATVTPTGDVNATSDTAAITPDVEPIPTPALNLNLDKEIVEAKIPEKVVEDTKIESEEDFTNLVIAKVDRYVNVRSLPSEEGEIVGKLYDKSVGNFLEEENGWYKIQSGKCIGYVKGEYCVTGEEANTYAKEVGTRMATVTTTTLRVREEPSLDASILGLVPIEEDLIVTEELDGWVKVDIEEGYGYVSLEYVDLWTDFVVAESKQEEEARLKKEKAERDRANAAALRAQQKQQAAAEAQLAQGDTPAPAPAAPAVTASGSGQGSNVANFALQFVGNPYAYGGTSLTNGADCSGFVMSVYSNFGVGLPHSSSGDRSVGYDVGGVENAIPGDIVCYSGHVGIYIGNGQIVHASTPKSGIVVGNVYYRTPICVRRIF